MNPFLVTNPGSRSRRGRRIAEEYCRLLRARGVPFETAETKTLADAETLTRRAIEGGADPVVAVGGDGTINRVLRGFFDGNGRPGKARMGVLYAGTSPDFCRYHGIPTEPGAAVDLLLDGEAAPVDVARLTSDGGRAAYFASSANVGLGAGIARRANRNRRWLGDFLGTLSATVATIVATRPSLYRLTIDGRDETAEKVLNVTIGKNPLLASGLKLDVDGRPDDGRLYCFVVSGISRAGLVTRLPGFYSGAAASSGRFALREGVTTVRIASLSGPAECECDGDPEGGLPIEVTVLPRALLLIRPKP
jgi:diacylglycerol kinase family enzyme